MTNPETLVLRLGQASARRMAPDHHDLDDLAQEASLRVAQVMEAKPDASVSYLGGVARNRIRDILAGKPYTGHEGRGPQDPLRRKDTAYFEGMTEDEEESRHLLTDGTEYLRVEWSALRREIEEAIDSIPQTGAYKGQPSIAPTIARFVMNGYSPSEAARILGYSESAGRKAWVLARTHLATRLAHLKEHVA